MEGRNTYMAIGHGFSLEEGSPSQDNTAATNHELFVVSVPATERVLHLGGRRARAV